MRRGEDSNIPSHGTRVANTGYGMEISLIHRVARLRFGRSRVRLPIMPGGFSQQVRVASNPNHANYVADSTHLC